jgi:hypothetical protein
MISKTTLREVKLRPIIVANQEEFAASMIAEEHDSLGSQDTEMLEEHFEEMIRNNFARKSAARDIFRRMLIHGSFQAAVFNVFMQLCLQGACFLSALEHPVD